MITIDWGTKIIFIPKTYLTFLSGVIFALDTNQLRLDLRDLEDDVDGMAFERTHNHNGIVTLSGVDYARVLEIINGYTVTFEDGSYRVSLQGTNNNIADITNVNSVSLITNNSAGLTDVEIQRELSYNNTIHYDSASEFSGTGYPVGTYTNPVNNLEDALVIAERVGTKNFILLSTMILDRDIPPLNFYSNIRGVIFTANGFNCDNSIFERLTLIGDFNDSSIVTKECGIGDCSNVAGILFNTGISGTLLVAKNLAIELISSFSLVPGIGTPTIDMHEGFDTDFSARGYSGGLKILNCDTPNSVGTIEYIAGKCNLDTTCSDGLLSIRGIPLSGLTNNSTGTIVDLDSIIDNTTQVKLDDIQLDTGFALSWSRKAGTQRLS